MNRIVIFLAGFLALMMSSASLKAQVGINTETPSPNSALQVVSPSKGVLIPQMSSADVQSIPIASSVSTGSETPAVGVNEDGLLVYNIQTGCYNYYNKATDQWWSLCGTLPPAVFTVDCSNVKAIGTYVATQALSINNYLQVPVTVTKAGTYTLTATTTDNNGNGYYFSASGTFPSVGNFIINLAGAGIPQMDGVNTINFVGNGTTADCTFNLTIQPGQPDYVITNVQQIPTAPWPENTDLTGGTYYVTVTLKVNRPGAWNLQASAGSNGYSFQANGQISEASGFNPNGSFPQTVQVNVPVISGSSNSDGLVDDFIMTNPGSATPSAFPFVINLAAVKFSIDCSSIDISSMEPLTQGTAIPSTAKITFPVTITSPGTTTLTATFAGLAFTSGPINLAVGMPPITLTPTVTGQAPNQSGKFPIKITSSEGGLTMDCVTPDSATVAPAQATFRLITITSATNNNQYLVDKRLGHSNTPCNLILSVNVDVAGEYDLTALVNGVTWHGTGSVPAGTSTITLQVTSDTPITNGTFPVSAGTSTSAYITYPKAGGGTAYVAQYNSIYFILRQINILTIEGRAMDVPSAGATPSPYTTATFSTNAILKAPQNFGPQGTVGVKAINVINGAWPLDNPNSILNNINANNIDIVFLAYDYFCTTQPNWQTLAKILKAFTAKGGVVIYASQHPVYPNDATSFLSYFYGQTTTVSTSNHTVNAPFTAGQERFLINSAALNSPILNGGPWGTNGNPKSATSIDFTGQYVGDDCGGTGGPKVVASTMPSTATAIATWTGNNAASIGGGTLHAGDVFMFYDETNNLFFCGDWAWANGRANNGLATDVVAYPATSDDKGNPTIKPNMYTLGGVPAGPVVNSFIYANVMAWAINKAANNRADGTIVP